MYSMAIHKRGIAFSTRCRTTIQSFFMQGEAGCLRCTTETPAPPPRVGEPGNRRGRGQQEIEKKMQHLICNKNKIEYVSLIRNTVKRVLKLSKYQRSDNVAVFIEALSTRPRYFSWPGMILAVVVPIKSSYPRAMQTSEAEEEWE